MATALLLRRVVKATLTDLMNLVIHVRPELDGAADSLMVAAIIGKNLLGVKDLIKKYKTANTMDNLQNVCKDAFLNMLGGNTENLKNVLTFSATRCDFIDFDNLGLEDFELEDWVLNYIDMVIVFGNTHQGTEGEAELHINAFLTSFNSFFSDYDVKWDMRDLQAFLTSDTAMSDNLPLSLYIGQQVAIFTGGPFCDEPPIGTFLPGWGEPGWTEPGWAIAEMAATAIPVLSGFSLDGGSSSNYRSPPASEGGSSPKRARVSKVC
jgi:hypothetical protein